MKSIPLAILFLLTQVAAVTLAEGWPHIRGPNYDGVSDEVGLANGWPEKGPPVLWVKELGQGYSSIVVRNQRAYTQY